MRLHLAAVFYITLAKFAASDKNEMVRQVVRCDFPWESSVLLFVHIFKAGGTTSRQMFQDWTTICGRGETFIGIQAGSCPHGSKWAKLPANNSKYICMQIDRPMNLAEQASVIQSRSVVAGHISFGFGGFIPARVPVYIQ